MSKQQQGADPSGGAGDEAGTRPDLAALGVLVGARADGDPEAAAQLARLADGLGYGEIMIGEATGHDAFALATALGGGTARLCIGPLPAAVRDPVTTARGAATVAALTGRTTGVALAASTSTVVEEWHGRSRSDAVTIVAESAQALRGLLAGERVDFSGVLVRTRGYQGTLPPSGGQLSVLAFGAELTEIAAIRADRLILPIGTVEHVSRLRARVQAAAERVGREQAPKIALWLPVAVEPEAEGRRTMLRDLVPYLRSAGFSGMFSEAGFGEVVRLARSGAHVRSVVAAAPPELLAAVTAVGDVAAVRAVLGEFRAVGVDDLILVPDRPETLELLAA